MTPTDPIPDEMYAEQAAYLAEHTAVTEKQAETYLRWYLANDDEIGHDLQSKRATNRKLAKRMDVSPSMFSKHLSKAKDRLEGDAVTLDAFKTMLALTDVGGATGRTHRVIGAQTTANAFVLVSEDGFDTGDRIATRYEAHLVYREPGSAHIDEDAPDDLIHYDKWTTFTVMGETDDHLAESLAYYMDTIDALDATDVVNVFNLLDDLDGFDVTIDDHTDAAHRAMQNFVN